ncbi:MAG: GNAT family N-acetyltransferase [Promethearchaeota archaeon]
MVTVNLDKIFNPQVIALIGASDREGSVGYTLMKNLIESGFEGTVYPINIRKKTILGVRAYPHVDKVPELIDLAIIATPAKTVPAVLEECGKAGIKGIIIISAGFKEVGPEGKALEEQLLAIKDRYNLRIIGPNCLGIISPGKRLNATFSPEMPQAGNIAFISQSGALGSAILDVALAQNIGFSHFVSVGSMIDVDFGDLIDYFGTDLQTRSILLYIEGLTTARKFMSAARHFARTKPIIVVKAGKYGASAKAAASHTGSLAGEDKVYAAAFKRAGMVRVDVIAELFNSAEVLGMQPIPRGPRLAIITNAGGPGVMAADALLARGGTLAALPPEAIKELDKLLPPHWSKGNPIDILGDATAERYRETTKIVLECDAVDGILIIYTPQMEDAREIARGIVGLCEAQGACWKTILTSFMGFEQVREANQFFTDNKIPTFSTPEQAVDTFIHMFQYKRNLELLYETPEELPVDSTPPRRPLTVVIRNAAREKRSVLTEAEAKQLLGHYQIPIVKTRIATTVDEAAGAAATIGYPVVMKILSPDILHKTDAGGVILDISTEKDLREAYKVIMKRAKAYNPKATIQGVTIQPMIKQKGYEVIIGAKRDPLFGPVILFGMGGVGVEFYRDTAIGLPPLNQTLARRIMEETRVYELLKKGYRNVPPANIALLEELLVRFSQMIVDFPQLEEVDINPLFVDDKQAFALDARILIDPKRSFSKIEPYQHLVISPYPKRYETLWKMRDGRAVLLRSIKPEDEPLWLEMFQNFSEESIRYRFFEIIKDTPHEVRVRYCNIDYDREIAIVAELTEKGERKILGVVRLIEEPDGKSGEIAVIVADQYQGLGLGSKMIDYMLEICIERKLETVYGVMLPDNYRAIHLMEKMGFTTKYQGDGTIKVIVSLKEEIEGKDHPSSPSAGRDSQSTPRTKSKPKQRRKYQNP